MKRYEYTVPGTGYRERLAKFKALWLEHSTADEAYAALEDVVHAMALTGATVNDIADYLGLARKEFQTVFGPAYRAAKAELKLIIAKETVEYCMTSQQPVAKIWLGKAFGGLSDNGPVDEVEVTVGPDGNGPVEFRFSRVVRKAEDGYEGDE